MDAVKADTDGGKIEEDAPGTACAFERDGFVVVPAVLQGSTLRAARAEATMLSSTRTETHESYPEHVLDMFVDTTLGKQARQSQSMYFQHRERLSAGQEPALARALRKLITQTLPQHVALATGWRLAELRLFNEHYIVKSPGSHVSFRWHRDADKQLAMCLNRDNCHYVSAWCPLDDTTLENGTLVVLPAHKEPSVSVDEDVGPVPLKDGDQAGVQPLEVAAGDVVLFTSSLWHCSPPNLTKRVRRVLYVQYSRGVITPTLSSVDPLNLAVPCGACSPSKHRAVATPTTDPPDSQDRGGSCVQGGSKRLNVSEADACRKRKGPVAQSSPSQVKRTRGLI